MNRKLFIKNLLSLALLPFIPFNLVMSCASNEDQADLKEIIGKKKSDFFKNLKEESGNSLYSFIEQKDDNLKLLDFKIKTDFLFYIIQSEMLERIALITNKKEIAEFKNHLISKNLGKSVESIKNDWGSSELFNIENQDFTIRLNINNSTEDNQIIIETKKIKSLLS